MALTRGRVPSTRERWRKVVEAIPTPSPKLEPREHEGMPTHCRGCGERVYLGAGCGRWEDADGEQHQCR